MPGDRHADEVSRFKNEQFAYWLLLSVPLFVVTALTLQALQVSVFVAFVAGIFFSQATDPLLNWFIDWWKAARRTNHAE